MVVKLVEMMDIETVGLMAVEKVVEMVSMMVGWRVDSKVVVTADQMVLKSGISME